MEVSSLELSRELHKLSGWNSGLWHNTANGITYSAKEYSYKFGALNKDDCIVYDSGYLLRRLPRYDAEGWNLTLECQGEEAVVAYYRHTDDRHKHEKLADTPEDALCKLAIALFKANILRRET